MPGHMRKKINFCFDSLQVIQFKSESFSLIEQTNIKRIHCMSLDTIADPSAKISLTVYFQHHNLLLTFTKSVVPIYD